MKWDKSRCIRWYYVENQNWNCLLSLFLFGSWRLERVKSSQGVPRIQSNPIQSNPSNRGTFGPAPFILSFYKTKHKMKPKCQVTRARHGTARHGKWQGKASFKFHIQNATPQYSIRREGTNKAYLALLESPPPKKSSLHTHTYLTQYKRFMTLASA